MYNVLAEAKEKTKIAGKRGPKLRGSQPRTLLLVLCTGQTQRAPWEKQGGLSRLNLG